MLRERGAQRERQVAADDAGGAHEPVLDVDQVHGAAEAVADARFAPHQLRHQAVDWRALGDRVSVGPVAAVDRVVGAQLTAHRRRDALAADAQMDQPVNLERAL